VGCLRSVEEIERIEPEWTGLWRSHGRSIFESPSWIIPFARWFVAAGKLRFWTIREDSRLIGILPMFLHGRQLLLLGCGIGDWLGAPMLEARREEILAEFFREMENCREEWSTCEWQALGGGTPLLCAVEPAGWCSQVRMRTVSPAIALRTSAEDSVPPELWEEISYGRRRAARLGAIRFELAGPGTLDGMLDILFLLHGERWRERGGGGVLAAAAVRAFHREAARRLLGRGHLRLITMWIGQRPAAAFYGFVHSRTLSYYLGGLDPKLAKAGPGKQVIAHAMDLAIGEGVDEFDFLRGSEPYKYPWGATDRPVFTRSLTLAQ
jgi:CelD/BcsL family acetyltransferase involved in cellulose biosynthesis